MRGIRRISQLSQSVTPDAQATLFPQPEPSLYQEKVELIIARYVYYLTHGDGGILLKTEQVLTKLSKEFFISTGRISDILVEHADTIAKQRKEPRKIPWYKSKWTHLVW
jgi:hypothetical protein